MVQGRTESAGQVYRPRVRTAKVAAFVCAALLVMSLADQSRSALWVASVPFLFFVQCFQRLEVSGNRVRRVGLRAVELDLATATVVVTGRSWWVELFFLGRSLELRDADGHRLFLESWLWPAATREALATAVTTANPRAAAARS